MKLSEFDFELPASQIAQSPEGERDGSRLLVVDRAGRREHRSFRGLPELLRPTDLLVINDARVEPARLVGKKRGSGGRAELLVVRPAAALSTAQALGGAANAVEWICLGQASKGFRPDAVVEFQGGLSARILESCGGGEYRVRFEAESAEPLQALMGKAGELPLPPYITRPPTEADRERYQTVYARMGGSVAAPTAGLHFTPAIFEALKARSIEWVSLTLDVGPGTFLPIRDDDVTLHKMHPERFEVSDETARRVNAARAEGRRIVAVGTTVVRTLESATDPESLELRSGRGETSLFIQPGFQFRQVDALLTNFHLPKSTLLVLVSAFLGREPTLVAYREAVAQGYRFFSYGDAMLIAG